MYCNCELTQFHQVHKLKHPLAIFILLTFLFRQQNLTFSRCSLYASTIYSSFAKGSKQTKKIYRLLRNHPQFFTGKFFRTFHTHFSYYQNSFCFKNFIFPDNERFTDSIHHIVAASDELYLESSGSCSESELDQPTSPQQIVPGPTCSSSPTTLNIPSVTTCFSTPTVSPVPSSSTPPVTSTSSSLERFETFYQNHQSASGHLSPISVSPSERTSPTFEPLREISTPTPASAQPPPQSSSGASTTTSMPPANCPTPRHSIFRYNLRHRPHSHFLRSKK